MTGIAVFYRYQHVLILIGGRNHLDIITFVIDIINFIKKMLENVGHICGFITVIAFGLVAANWILAMDTGHCVASFRIVGGTVYCRFVC
jgi:hypothetical protein